MSSRPLSFVSPLAPLARFVLVATGAGLMVSTSLAATSSDQAQEYIQARKIALKDANVQAAFDRANEKLDDRIIEIDPSLKPYVEKRRSQAAAVRQPAKPVPASAAKQPVVAKKNAGGAVTHVVAKGETLSSIALEYKISVASLKSANNISDDRKLRAGQKLVIPTVKSGAAETNAKPGFWDRLWNNF